MYVRHSPTVIAQRKKIKIADKNICGKYFRDIKMTLLDKENVYFMIANIIFANIFIRKKFQLYGSKIF
jgi:hypothetical protein